MDSLRRFAESASKAASAAGKSLGGAADAVAKQTARAFGGGSPALALVGQTVTVQGKALEVDSLLAEGAFPAAQRF